MSRGSTTVWIIVAVVIVIVAGGWLWLRSGDNQPVPDSSLDLTFKSFDGDDVRLVDLKGTPLVVNAWATWCPFCVDELSDFAAVQKEFGDKVLIIAVDRAEPLSVARDFVEELGIVGDLLFVLDTRDNFYQAIGGFSMPETLFIDAKGELQFHKRGFMTEEEIRQRVSEIVS